MSGLIAIAGRVAESLDQGLMEQTINLAGDLQCTSIRSGNTYFCSSRHALAPGHDARAFEDDDVIAAFAGDIVNSEQIDWHAILRSLRSGATDLSALTNLRGAFALAVYDIRDGVLHVVTDPFSWQPVYCQQSANSIAVSTRLATFLNLPAPARAVNDAWIHQFFFFNYGVDTTTPLQGVSRLPPGLVTSFNSLTGETTQRAYRDKMKRSSPPLSGRDARSRAVAVFQDVVPRYFSASESAVIGLSAGLDSRTLLAALPDATLDRLDSFTYGIPGSTEITKCAQIAASLDLRHDGVPLGDEFQQRLPQLARDTVFLSDGLQNINRSHLLYVYRQLNRGGQPYSTLVTGVSGDHIFRDHIRGMGNVPHMMSAELARQHRLGRSPIDYTAYRTIFRHHHDELENTVESTLDEIEAQSGEFGDPQSYLTYLMYVVGPHYFSGEAAIANSVTTFRNPYWDPDIVELGYQLKEATMGASESPGRRDKYAETQVQIAVVAANQRVRRVPYLDLPIHAYASGKKTVFQIYRAARKARSVLRRHSFIYGEDWPGWYRNAMQEEIAELLGDDSRIREYISAECIDNAVSNSDVHWLGKLITAEHTLRLIEKRWMR
jgi:asparagine synthetase B (glutamine-hydrolysing)